MAGLPAAARKPTNLAKVNLVRQEPTESLSVFLGSWKPLGNIHLWTPRLRNHAAVLLAFVNQAAPDIRGNYKR